MKSPWAWEGDDRVSLSFMEAILGREANDAYFGSEDPDGREKEREDEERGERLDGD